MPEYDSQNPQGEAGPQQAPAQQPSGQDQLIMAQPYMETASATTNPDNVNSGNTAYVIAAVVLVLLLAIGSSLGGVLSSLIQAASARGISYYEQEYGSPDGNGESIEDLLKELGGSDGGSGAQPTSQTSGSESFRS